MNEEKMEDPFQKTKHRKEIWIENWRDILKVSSKNK